MGTRSFQKNGVLQNSSQEEVYQTVVQTAVPGPTEGCSEVMTPISSNVKVYARIKPTTCFAQDFMEYLPNKQALNVRYKLHYRRGCVKNQIGTWSFQLNGVLQNASQEEVYQTVAQKAVLGAIEGCNGTIMCFGQTGAGKTYTMNGPTDSYKERGIIPRALQEVFNETKLRKKQTFSVSVSYLQIYNDTLIDLLTLIKKGQSAQDGALDIIDKTKGGISVKGLSLHPVRTKDDALKLFFMGEKNKLNGEHVLNKCSSRSHCIFTIHIKSQSGNRKNVKYFTSKLNLVDLAGSEKNSQTKAVDQLQQETVFINTSLSFLEHTILALSKWPQEHVPFRQSKLTHALKDSLGGNCNTVLVANICGEAVHIEETLSTLRFMARVKGFPTEPAVHEQVKPTCKVQKMQKEIQRIKQAIKTDVEIGELSNEQVVMIRGQVQKYLAGQQDKLEIVNVRQIQEIFVQLKKSWEKEYEKVKSLTEDTSTPPSVQKERPPSFFPVKARTAPPKPEAFDNFKADKGINLNRSLLSNKTALLMRHNEIRKLTATINSLKKDIDRLKTELLLCQTRSQSEDLPEDDQTMQDEAELDLLFKLRETKDQYRQIHRELLDAKEKIGQRQLVVDKCREHMLTEFERWYTESFLLPEEVLSIYEKGPIRPGLIPLDKALEYSEHQQLQKSDEAFYNSQSKLLQRHRQGRLEERKYLLIPG